MIPLMEMSRTGQSTDRQSGVAVTRGCGYVGTAKGDGVSFGGDAKFWNLQR